MIYSNLLSRCWVRFYLHSYLLFCEVETLMRVNGVACIYLGPSVYNHPCLALSLLCDNGKQGDTPGFYCLGTDITLQKVEFLHFYNSATLPGRKIKLKTFQIFQIYFLPMAHEATPSSLSGSTNVCISVLQYIVNVNEPSEYLANGLWLTLVTVLVTRCL